MKPLTVYKASAGSGKTFRLAVEYIKLLIENPYNYKHILAVTFTNKATEEMKTRILSQLYGIWKQLPESRGYIDEVCSGLCVSEEQASERAGTALTNLMHNYHYFRVETIDSFFQSILRNLARELDLVPNLKIGLDENQVEEQAVDIMVESLNRTSEILQWLISYIFTNIDDGKGWNVIGQVKKFGRTIFSDTYKTVGKQLAMTLAQQGFFDAYVSQVIAVRDGAAKKMAAYAASFEQITADAGLQPTSFSGGTKGICSYFRKLRSRDFSDSECRKQALEKCLASAEGWAAKSSPDRATILALADSRLLELLREAEAERPLQWRLYSTAECTLRHLDKLRLLNAIDENVKKLNDESGMFLLGDTQYLLHALIGDSDTPFIFEKAGCRLEHIMIDEFQDTSVAQWQNFKLLLDECMSRTDSHARTVGSLIVGDVKQSIYRWRSGDWRLLNNIENMFGSAEDNVEVKEMRTNYRSQSLIVEFNNHFFELAAREEYARELETNDDAAASEILSAYADVTQTPCRASEGRGMVRITLLPSEEYERKTLEEVDSAVTELLATGIPAGKIAVLVRKNRHIPLLAEYLSACHSDLRIVSDEAFRLDSSVAVGMIIMALRLLAHPADGVTRAALAIAYQKHVERRSDSASTLVSNDPESSSCIDTATALLPEKFITAFNQLRAMSLPDLVETVCQMFNIDRIIGQGDYVSAFMAIVSDFAAKCPSGLDAFLREWEASFCRTTIQGGDAEGIRLVSIHKSKGLEFDNVIIPFCDWALQGHDTTLWCQPADKPFSGLPIVPVDYSRRLLDTIYAPDYRNEHVQENVDNLNLLYVAFTRAARNLIVFGRKGKSRGASTSRSELLSACLPQLVAILQNSTLEGETDANAPTVFQYGYMALRSDSIKGQPYNPKTVQPENRTTVQNYNPITLKPYIQTVKVESSPMAVSFKQSLLSRDFTRDDGDGSSNEYVKTGSLLHRLLSSVRTSDDIERAIAALNVDGALPSATAKSLATLVAGRLSESRAARWFAPGWRVMNECAILSPNAEGNSPVERRPDRVVANGSETVVIDFKFARPRPEHSFQVAEYMRLLDQMGCPGVKGYLWYVYTDDIVEVKSEK